MQRNNVLRVSGDPLAQELMQSNIPAEWPIPASTGSARVVPLGFHCNGAQFVICTIPDSPKVRALAAHPLVALTIDTDRLAPHVLLVRGTVSLETVEGVPPEYFDASHKQVSERMTPTFEAERGTYKQIVRISIEPRWAKLLDFRDTPANS